MNKFATALILAVTLAIASAHPGHDHHDHHDHEDQNHSESDDANSHPDAFIDLSHPLENKTLHWPTNGGFSYIVKVDGIRQNQNNESYYVKSDAIDTAIHSGTHLDAPRHFSQSGWTVEQIPLNRLVDVPVKVIDVSSKVLANRSYNFVVDDFIDPLTNTSLIKGKEVVLIYTGISKFYDQGQEAYMGTNTTNMAELKQPGFSKEAAQYLADKGIYGVGLDAASVDGTTAFKANNTFDPVAHVIFTSRNIYILENVSNRLSELVNKDSTYRLVIAPLPIVNGSGSQIRLIAMKSHSLPASKDTQMVKNSGSQVYQISYLVAIVSTSLALIHQRSRIL